MSTPLRVLILEDRSDDAELVLHELHRAGYTPIWQRVETEAEYLAALNPALDIILADYALPQFDGLRALTLVRARGLDVPLIIVSGTIGEDIAVAAMQRGAADYLLKDRLTRLGSAVAQALEKRQLHMEMQRAEVAIRKNAQLYQEVLHSLTAEIAVLDANGTIIVVNNAWMHVARIHGGPRLNMTSVGLNYFDICCRNADRFNDIEAEIVIAGLQRILHRQQPYFTLEYTYKAETNPHSFVMHAMPLSNHSGIVVAHEDITARKRAEEALQESEARYRLIAENTGDLISMLDQNGHFVYVSPSYHQMLGYHPTRLIGRLAAELVHPDDQVAMHEAIEQIFTTGTAQITQRQRHADGPWLWIEGQITAVVQQKGGYIVNIGRDITERKRLEAQFLQSQKMESVGQLAGGVAHDFNNLLTVITGYAEIVLSELPVGSAAYSDLQEITKATGRATTLTRQLLAFARKQVIAPHILNLNDLIAEIEKLLRRLLGANIDLETSLEPNLGQIKADPGQIEQVLVNLAVNARDAMPDGGTLTIETNNIVLDHIAAHHYQGLPPGPYVVIVVSDTGIGMDDHTQQHVFEPFFTTKGLGRGTGLGLATCYGIVTQHGGTIWIESEPQHGTTITIYLPRSAVSIEHQPAPANNDNRPHGTETVLLAEDNPAIRTLTARVLRNQGYTVLEAADGEAALRLARAHSDAPIHLLLTDLVMPHMSGKALFEQFSVQWPDAKTLFITGYADDAITHFDWLNHGMALLHKPFSFAALARKVREVLDTQV